MRLRFRPFPSLTRIALALVLSLPSLTVTSAHTSSAQAKYIILMIGDGQGSNQLLAARQYTGNTPEYQTWSSHWVSTYPNGGSYDSNQA